MKELIELRAESIERLKQTLTFQRLLNGKLTRDIYIRYLIDVYHYAQHSPKVIALAGSRCAGTRPALAAYLFRHAEEEIGHELWAYSDLVKLGLSDDQIKSSRPGTCCTAMVGMEYYVAGHWNPAALFGWLFVLEAFGDDVGNFIADKVDASFRLNGNATYFLTGHGAADHCHVKDITETLDQHMKDSTDISDMLHIAKVSRDLYLGILEEVTTEKQNVLGSTSA